MVSDSDTGEILTPGWQDLKALKLSWSLSLCNSTGGGGGGRGRMASAYNSNSCIIFGVRQTMIKSSPCYIIAKQHGIVIYASWNSLSSS